MTTSLQIDFIVEDSIKAAEIYEKVFGAEILEVTSEEKGLNEALFNIFGARFHILDENEEDEMEGPVKDEPNPMWCNFLVENLEEIFNKAEQENFKVIEEITVIEEYGILTAVIRDPFGYEWVLNELLEEESSESCCTIAEDEME